MEAFNVSLPDAVADSGNGDKAVLLNRSAALPARCAVLGLDKHSSRDVAEDAVLCWAVSVICKNNSRSSSMMVLLR